MPDPFTLDLTLTPTRRAILRLHDSDGLFLAHSEHTVTTPLPDPTTLLGPAILLHLADGIHQRTLILRLPDSTLFPLAADLARVPWELARAPGASPTLLERNVIVRISLAAPSLTPASPPIAPTATEPLRVLLVFAEAPGTRPLAARLERERLLDLFFTDILRTNDVEIDVLAHGVTRVSLIDQIRSRAGYHIVHWSGHGQDGVLHLAAADGTAGTTSLTAADLANLFVRAGGFVPDLMVISACHSGSTRTALALLAAGVRQIVAMRGEVGDTYARRLARRFYRNLLADRAHHPVDAALFMARAELARDTTRAADYLPTDHAMPIVFGDASLRFEPRARRSAQVERRHPRPQPPPGLDKPPAFIGRGEALAKLGHTWLDPAGPRVAVVVGPAGIGKTALAAEALHLWFGRFDHVLAFQADGTPLAIEDVFQRAHQRLIQASVGYRERCADNERAAVYLPPSGSLTGEARVQELRSNLVQALSVERVLILIDCFDASLLSTASAQDPAWDALLGTLAGELAGTGSRVLLTSRRAPAAIPASRSLRIDLGLLPAAEAAVFFEAHPVLRTLRRGGDPGGILARLTEVAHGHPFILARFAAIAQKHALRDGTLSPAGRVALETPLAASPRRATTPCPGSAPTRAETPSPPASWTS